MIRLLRCLDLPFLSPGRAKKRHSFHSCEFGRREALSTPKPEGARKRARRSLPRRAAQAGWTEGAERSLEFARKRMSKTRISRRLHHIVLGVGVAGRNRPA